MNPASSRSDAVSRVLVVAPSWIGDAIMAEPLFARLRQGAPDLRLDALAPAWVTPALSRMPGISGVIENPCAHGELALRKRFHLARDLARRGYRRAYVLPNSFKSALVPFFARIPVRVGFTGECRLGLVNVRHKLDKGALPLMVERFAQLAQEPGTPLVRPVAAPRLVSTQAAQMAALSALELENPERLVVFCPGAEYGPAKRWPARHFAALARELTKTGCAVWLLGSAKDRALAEDICRQASGGCRNLCGKTRVDQAIDLIALAKLVVCNDSGLMHVTAALSRPVLAIFGSSSPNFTPPLSDRAVIVRHDLPCSPCFKRVCPLGHSDCLENIAPQEVFDLCQPLLN
ncbi:MAG: lipopolysaccharide heptosyltransferase II [Zoogloeaceae bacterium]|jgi:heptosyltransferase-2|nr:lipopolysaccharide heptosyltransferase II [Zoogloeaceae bacterium]